MNYHVSALLLVTLLGPQPPAAYSVRLLSEASLTESPLAPPSGVLAASASREVRRLVRETAPAPPRAQSIQPQPTRKGWIARHPKLFGALVGFGAGCAVGASRVGGSEDTFFNALDEFACPAVGGIGAVAGALVGSLIK